MNNNLCVLQHCIHLTLYSIKLVCLKSSVTLYSVNNEHLGRLAKHTNMAKLYFLQLNQTMNGYNSKCNKSNKCPPQTVIAFG